jgi:hypothetical protein
MSRFFVGQKVRVSWARTEEYKWVVGREARITEIWEDFYVGRTGYGLDILPISLSKVNGLLSAFADDQLEPILDNHQPCDAEFKESLDKLLEGLTRPCKGEV